MQTMFWTSARSGVQVCWMRLLLVENVGKCIRCHSVGENLKIIFISVIFKISMIVI